MTATPIRAAHSTNEALARSAARLAAVQAIYQIDVTAEEPEQVIRDFVGGKVGGVAITQNSAEDPETPVILAELDSGLFIALVRGVLDRGEEIETMIKAAVSAEWPFERLEMILRSILRAGVAELLSCPEIPARVTVSEFIEVAHAFYSGHEPRMVNAVLDRIARSLGRLDGER